jgi:hypothetical protein
MDRSIAVGEMGWGGGDEKNSTRAAQGVVFWEYNIMQYNDDGDDGDDGDEDDEDDDDDGIFRKGD